MIKRIELRLIPRKSVSMTLAHRLQESIRPIEVWAASANAICSLVAPLWAPASANSLIADSPFWLRSSPSFLMATNCTAWSSERSWISCADSSIVYLTHQTGSFAAASSSQVTASGRPGPTKSAAAERLVSGCSLVRFARFLSKSITGLMATRIARSASARIASSLGIRLASPFWIRSATALLRTAASSLFTSRSACSIGSAEETTVEAVWSASSAASADCRQSPSAERSNKASTSSFLGTPARLITDNLPTVSCRGA